MKTTDAAEVVMGAAQHDEAGELEFAEKRLEPQKIAAEYFPPPDGVDGPHELASSLGKSIG